MATIAVVHPPGGLPVGQIYHAAGVADGGILISAVWESKEQADRFVSDTLLPGHAGRGGLQRPAGRAHGRGDQPDRGLVEADPRRGAPVGRPAIRSETEGPWTSG